MAKWNIYHKDGTALKDVDGELVCVHELEYQDQWMSECYLTINFKHHTTIDFNIGDYVLYRGERFELNYDPGKQKQARKNTYGEGFVYDNVKFNALQDELSRTEFLDVVLNDNQLHYTSLPKFSFYVETIDDLLDRIQANLDEQIGKGMWKIFSRSIERSMQRGVTEEEWKAVYGDEETDAGDFDSQSITVDSQTCWEALALANSKWDINFVVRNRNVYVGTAGKVTEGIFRYGLGKGLYEVDQNADEDQTIITRLRAYGSDKNLPEHYYADLGTKYKTDIANVIQATDTGIELALGMDYLDSYFTEERKYKNGDVSGKTYTDGWVLTATFDQKTVITGYVKKGTGGKALFRTEVWGGLQYDNGLEKDKNTYNTFLAQVKEGKTTLYITSGLNKNSVPSDMKEYAENLPNNMAISRLMLPGFPKMSLKEFWDSMTDEEKKYVNPTGKEHIFSTDKYRPYIDSINLEKIGLRAGSQFFDTDDKANGIVDIYPTIEEMEINGVRIDEIYKGSEIDDDGRYDDGKESPKNFDIYLNPAIDFDINELRDDDFAISMKDGKCGGRDFKVASAIKIEGNWRLTLERVKDDALGLYFPYKDYQIEKGNHFVLTGIDLPDSYVRAASLKLLKYAIALLDDNDYTKYVYQPKVDEIFMARQHDAAMADKTGATKSYHDTLKAGDIMRIEDEDLGISADVTIDQLVIKEEDGKIPTYEVTLREDKQVGTIEKIQQQISSLQSGNGGKGGGGATISQVKSYVASEGAKHFLSKLFDDTASGFITFLKGLKATAASYFTDLFASGSLSIDGDTQLGKNGTNTDFGEYHADSTGARISVNEDGTSTAEFDYITIRRAADFRSISIRELKHIGGELAISAAAMVCSKVEPLDDNGDVATDEDAEIKAYKCYFDTSDSENGKQKVFQQFMVGDQARCQQFDIKSVGETKKTRYYWRLVTEVGEDYIVLSDVDKDKLSTTEPQTGDNIVQLGYRYDDEPNRQSALIFSATAKDSPSSKYYQGINDYSLDHLVKDEGYDAAKGTFHSNVYGNSYTGDKGGISFFSYDAKNKKATFKGEVNFTSATKLPEGTTLTDGENDYELTTKKDLENLNIKSGNLLRNTSFSGDYESVDVAEDMEVSDDKETYSEKLQYWTSDDGCEVKTSDDTESGRLVELRAGSLQQKLVQPLLDGERYVICFVGKGTTLNIAIGGNVLSQEMTAEWKRYELYFANNGESNDLVAFESENATIADIMLVYGTIAPAWSPAYVDNDKSVAQFQNIKYLSDAINEASTTIDGGLVMSQQIKVGNYRNNRMTKETGGISGYYNDDNSPFLWGGGTLEQAIRTIQKYKDNPTFKPTEEDLREMVNFVVTHGGRAILNDIILRGIIYAEGGVMKSVRSPNGNFEIDDSGNAKLKGEINSTKGTIGGFDIGANRIGSLQEQDEDGNIINSSSETMSLFPNEIIFNSKYRQAILGCAWNYMKFMLRLDDEEKDVLSRYGAMIGVRGSVADNIAIAMNGGKVTGLNFSNETFGFNDYYISDTMKEYPSSVEYEIKRATNCVFATTMCNWHWKTDDKSYYEVKDQQIVLKLPDMKWYDDGHEILIKRGPGNSNSVVIKAQRTCILRDSTKFGEQTTYTEEWYPSVILKGAGDYVTEYALESEMDSICLRFFKNLTVTIDGTKHQGFWVEFKHPRAW